MGVKPVLGELNAALKPIFAHIPNVYLIHIHDDLIIASETFNEHNLALEEVMKAMDQANLTLNPKKYSFGKTEVAFWGMIFSSSGVITDPEKVKDLENLSLPKNRSELKSFICMMQSSSDFIPNFSKNISALRELLNSDKHYKWIETHQKVFNNVLDKFKKETLLSYFDISKPTFIFTDAHQLGLSAILSQGSDKDTAKPVAFTPRCTSKAEKNYAPLDLEAMVVDFALKRFRSYLVGAPNDTIIVNDHIPLLSVFNGKRNGSIRTERMKLRNKT